MHKHVSNDLPNFEKRRSDIINRKFGVHEKWIPKIGNQINQNINNDYIFGNWGESWEHIFKIYFLIHRAELR